MRKLKNDLLSTLLKKDGIKKLLIIVGTIIAAVILFRFVIGITLFAKLFGFASNHLQRFEKETTRIEKRLDQAEQSMRKAQEDVWTAVEETHITEDLGKKIMQVEFDRQFEKYKADVALKVNRAVNELNEGGQQEKEEQVLALIADNAGNIREGIKYNIDKAIALKRQISELKAELATLQGLAALSEAEERRKNAIINYLNDIKLEDLNEDMDHWLARSRAEKPGCYDYNKCKDNAASAEHIKTLVSALEDYIKAGHFVSGEMRDGIYIKSHTRSVKEILNSARQAAGMPYERMTKEEKEAALQAERETLNKIKEDEAKKEKEAFANRR